MTTHGTRATATAVEEHGIHPDRHTRAARHVTRTGRGAPHHPYAGSGHLLRLALREDRLRIALWTAGLAGMAVATVPSVESAYGGLEGMQARAEVAGNPATVLINGPTFSTGSVTLGSVIASELGMMTFLAVAVMSILLVTRHTRAAEDSGRTDLVLALSNGRFSPAVAALGSMAVANLVVGTALFAGLQGHGLPQVDLLAFCCSVVAAGLVFGALAAVTAQVADHSRAASGLALLVLGASYLLRGIGDVRDPVDGTALSWVSPLAWLQQVRPWVDLRWWPIVLTLATTVLLVAVASVLAARRDLGAGLVAGRAGRPDARGWLSSPTGLAAHELLGDVLAWAGAIAAFALLFGLMMSTMVDAMADVPMIREWMALDPGSLDDSMLATMLVYSTLGTAGFAVAATLHLRHEEQSGTAAVAVVDGPGRSRWLASWVAVVVVATLVVQVAGGLGLGLGVALDAGDWWAPARLTAQSLPYWPAALVFVGLTVALYGLWPRWSPVAWALVSWALFAAMFGPLLDLPEWALDLSPVEVAPRVPWEELSAWPLVALTALAAVLVGVGLVAFRRRDLG